MKVLLMAFIVSIINIQNSLSMIYQPTETLEAIANRPDGGTTRWHTLATRQVESVYWARAMLGIYVDDKLLLMQQYRIKDEQQELVKENSQQDFIDIYPNPAQDIVFVKCTSNRFDYSITNAMGEVVLKESLNCSEGEYAQINTHALSKGIYLLRVSANEVVKKQKLTIIK